ncbi:hypothetical protein [Caulobacter sp. RHG1]|uniref:hypothetical protein n=1 Tax=Caulobacter sp. (strain RHG1) TaxID=2545762 RepID=UPI001555D786|nr:hypothetical protein [Caulobacter sp. RHG1]
MGSRRKTGGAVARLPELSRRAVLVGASATPALAGRAPAPGIDPTIAACDRWFAVEAERERLSAEWGHHESFLAREFNWFRLSEDQRRALPQARKLDDIAVELEALDRKSDALLKALPSTPAASVAAVVANLTIATRLLYPDGYEEVHGLMVRAVRDLKTLSRPT